MHKYEMAFGQFYHLTRALSNCNPSLLHYRFRSLVFMDASAAKQMKNVYNISLFPTLTHFSKLRWINTIQQVFW